MKNHSLNASSDELLDELERLARVGNIRWCTDSNHYHLSSGAARILNLNPDHQLPEADFFSHFVHSDDLPELTQQLQQSLENLKPINATFRVKNAGRTDIFVNLKAEPVTHDKEETCYSGALINVSELVTHQNQLKLAAEELERSNKDLEQFAYIASHDLQEPLRKIRAFGDLMKLEIDKGNHADIGQFADRMQNAAQRMQTLVHDLLVYSRISKQGIEFESVDLNQIVHGVIEDHSLAIGQCQAQIQVAELPRIEGHQTRLSQLFHNLISNALKFRNHERTPQITISGRPTWLKAGSKNQHKIEGVEIEVTDNGIGFEQEYSDKIFTLFQRLHGRNEYKGTGIGLALVKKVVELHQGEVHVTSTLGQGSTFKLLLPVKQLSAWKKTQTQLRKDGTS